MLDVATGIGEPAVTAARRVGPGGQVVGTDLSSEMLVIARERVSALGLKNLAFRQVDAEGLDFPESSFDAVLCRFGLMFLPDLPSVLRRIRSLVRPNGRFAAAVWGIPPKVPMLSLAMGVLQRELQLPPPPPGTPNPFNLSAPGLIEQALSEAGFSGVRSEVLVLSMEVPSVETYIEVLRDIAPPLREAIGDQPKERQEELWQAIAAAARQHALPDGKLRMPNEAICAVGQR